MNVEINYTIEEIASICNATWIQKNKSLNSPAWLSLDSRKLLYPRQTLFVALKTSHRNAKVFVDSLYKMGVRNFILDNSNASTKGLEDANVLLVEDPLLALQQLAAHHRQRFPALNVIGVTGSNGKTVVKEWLYHLLAAEYNVIRSPKSFNSQVGVPLSVLAIRPQHELAIIEAGISTRGEMERLEKIIKPGIGILTNIGNAHDAGFRNRREKAAEKLKLFSQSRMLVLQSGISVIHTAVDILKKNNSRLQVFDWGGLPEGKVRILSVKSSDDNTVIKARHKRKRIEISIPFTDKASIENALQCLSLLVLLGKLSPAVLARFNTLFPVAMRLEMKAGIRNSVIINDSYSNDLYSLNMALDLLLQQKKQKRIVILSDIAGSALPASELYQKLASLLIEKKVDHLIGIGPSLYTHQSLFSALAQFNFYKSTGDFTAALHHYDFYEAAILVKGARYFEFEKITVLLEQKVHQTILSINTTALAHNLRKYKEYLSPHTKIMAVVKAFAYGSGSAQVAAVLEYNKADHLAVAYTDEAVDLRQAGITLPIMVMNVDSSTFHLLIQHNLEPEIFSFGILDEWLQFLSATKTNAYPIHLKLDTGMHRLGFMENEIKKLGTILSGNRHVKVKSVFSHLVASDDPMQDDFTRQQYNSFVHSCESLEKSLGYGFIKHIANTAAVSRLPHMQLDMIRTGIGLYGVDTNKKMQNELRNVCQLTTSISQIKKLRAGESVGYGRHAILKKDSTIATVRIGYADGYPRSLGNGVGHMLIQNTLVTVIGNICMDMTMVDVSALKNVKEGDPVMVFGDTLSVQQVATWAQTISYEILAGISQRVKRTYVEE